MILARRAQPIVDGGRAKRRPRCWAIDEFFAGNRQAKLPCGTRALWDALSARQDNDRRPEPGAPLRSAPGYDGAGPSDRNKRRPNTRAGGLPRNFKLRGVLGATRHHVVCNQGRGGLHGGTVTLIFRGGWRAVSSKPSAALHVRPGSRLDVFDRHFDGRRFLHGQIDSTILAAMHIFRSMQRGKQSDRNLHVALCTDPVAHESGSLFSTLKKAVEVD